MTALPIRVDDSDGVWPPEGYTGEWGFHWPNGQLKYHAHYVNGQTDGEVVCYWDNGQIAQFGISVGGKCRGVWTDYHQDGMKYKETDYQGDGDFTVRWFDSGGTVFRCEIWKEGTLISKESSSDDIFAELDEMYADILSGIVDDEIEEDDDEET